MKLFDGGGQVLDLAIVYGFVINRMINTEEISFTIQMNLLKDRTNWDCDNLIGGSRDCIVLNVMVLKRVMDE